MKFPIRLSDRTLVCSELTLKEYKDILKVTYGDEPDKEVFLETVTSILSSLTSTPQEFFKELSAVELLILLITIRVQSMGEVTTVTIKRDNTTASLDLRLDWIKEDLEEIGNTFHNFAVPENNYTLFLSPPSLSRLAEPLAEDEFLYFIKEVTFNETQKAPIDTNGKARALFRQLPARTSTKIFSYFHDFVHTIKNTNFLARYGIEDQTLTFVPSVESVMWFMKLMYNESLESFFDNVFYLSHHSHLNSAYLETCSPGEYMYLSRKLQEVLTQGKNTQPGDDFSGSVEDHLPEDLQDSSVE